MYLLVDCGNTLIKWALADADGIVARGRVVHDGRRDAAIDEVAQLINADIVAIYVASVLEAAFSAALCAALGPAARRLEVVSPAYGIEIAYRDASALGVDRWLAMVAAKANVDEKATGPVCVVSAGTAVTFDAIAADGRHLGGYIWPGPHLVADVLATHTDGIGHTPVAIDARADRRPLGTDTDTAVGYGSLFAIASAIDRAAKIAMPKCDALPRLLLTGGDAELIFPWLDTPATIEPDLVIEAMMVIATSRESK